MDNKDILISALSKDTLLAGSYSDWLRARTRYMDDNLSLISDFLSANDDAITVSSFLADKGVDADRGLIIGDYVGKISDFLTKIELNEFDEDALISSLYTDAVIAIGDIIDESVAQQELRNAIATAGDALKLSSDNNGKNPAEIYTQLLTAQSTNGALSNLNINTSILSILTSDRSSFKEKINVLNSLMIGDIAETNVDDIDLTFETVPMKEMTGINPVACVLDDIVAPDLSSIKAAVKTICSAFKSVGQAIGGFFKKAANKVGVYFDQLTSNPNDFDRYDTPGDGTIDNVMYQIRIPASWITTTSNGFLRKLSDKYYIHLSTTFCEMYIFGTFDIHGDLSLVNVKLLWKPVNMATFEASVKATMNEEGSYGSKMFKAFALFNNNSYFSPKDENEIYEGIISSKQLLMLYSLILNGLVDDSTKAEAMLILVLWAGNMESVRVYPQGTTVTNTKVCQELIGSSITSPIAEANEGVYIYDIEDEDVLAASIISILQYYENSANSGVYVPYVLCNNIDRGSIFVKDDDQNSELYRKFLMFSGLTVTAVATLGIVSKVSRNLKLWTLSTGRNARNAIKQYDISGDSVDKVKALKAIKKYNLVSKLSGNFGAGLAAVPSLLSTVTLKSGVLSNDINNSLTDIDDIITNSLNSIDEIKELIV